MAKTTYRGPIHPVDLVQHLPPIRVPSLMQDRKVVRTAAPSGLRQQRVAGGHHHRTGWGDPERRVSVRPDVDLGQEGPPVTELRDGGVAAARKGPPDGVDLRLAELQVPVPTEHAGEDRHRSATRDSGNTLHRRPSHAEAHVECAQPGAMQRPGDADVRPRADQHLHREARRERPI